jgi:hypothetical protein
MKNRPLHPIPEAQELMGDMCRNKIYHLMNTGELASVVIGCRRYISDEAIAAFIAKSTTTQSPAKDPARSRKTGKTATLPLSSPPASRSRSPDNKG